MSKVFVNIELSLDGYMAPEGMTMDSPEYKNWGVTERYRYLRRKLLRS